MSYQRETDTVLTGSLNLLTPGDALPPEDALCLRNWRVDQTGALRSRLGQSTLATPTGLVHSVHMRGTHVYTGAGANLLRDGSVIASGLDGTRIGFANMAGYCYIMNLNLQTRDDGTSLKAWGLPAPSAAPTVEGEAGGELAIGVAYQYFVTFLTADGEETSGSPPAVYVPDNPNQNCKVTRPSPPAGTYTHWRLYRLGNNLQNAYSVEPNPFLMADVFFTDDGGYTIDGGDTTFHSDQSLEKLGIEMPTDNDLPPVCRGLVGPYYDRLLAWNSTDHPNWLFWSKQLQLYAWPGAARVDGNHAPVGDDDEPLLRVMLHARHCRLYKAGSLWRLSGDPEDPNAVLEVTAPEIGLAAVGAIDSVGELDYFEGPEGIYVSNGYTAKKISLKVDPVFKGDAVPLPGSDPAAPLNLASRGNNTLAVVNGRLYFSYASGSATTPNATLVYDIDGDRWYSDDRAFAALSNEGTGGFFGGGTSVLWRLEQAQAAAIALAYQTGFRNQGNRDRQKTYADVAIEYSVAQAADSTARSLSVSAAYNFGDATAFDANIGALWIESATAIVGPPRKRAVISLGPPLETGGNNEGHMARNVSIRIAGNCTVPATIYSIELHYYLEARDALTFDSDEQHLGYQGVKLADLLEFDIDASGAWTWEIWSDRPGGAMAKRQNATAAATTGRQSVQVTFPAVEGRLLRIAIAGAATFRLYGARVRYREIGVALNGAAGEVFFTPELDMTA